MYSAPSKFGIDGCRNGASASSYQCRRVGFCWVGFDSHILQRPATTHHIYIDFDEYGDYCNKQYAGYSAVIFRLMLMKER